MSKKTKATESTCEFCANPEWAVMHMVEDEALMRVANAAAELLSCRRATISAERERSLEWKELAESLVDFRNIEHTKAARLASVRSLQQIEADLS